MFFVVRIDTAEDDGQQRVFGCYDTKEKAQQLKDQMAAIRVGDFRVFEGQEVQEES